MIGRSDLGIVADDLTGACDTAACFSTAQSVIEVFADLKRSRGRPDTLSVYNTQSRLKSIDECKALMREAALFIEKKRIVLKKIDTAFRGRVGAELEALSTALGIRSIVVAPAIPRIGRTTRGGMQYDNGVPIDETPYSKDPVSPVDSADILELIRRTGDVRCDVMDAETESDLDGIVEKGLREPRVIFAGSLGLAEALAGRIEKARTPPREAAPAERVLVLCGSRYERSRVQIETVRDVYGVNPLDLSPTNGASPNACAFDRYGIGVLRLMAGEVPPEAAASDLSKWFADSILGFLKESRPDALVIIGGETAYRVVHALGVGVLRVFGRISDVTPFGVIGDGDFQGCRFATKGGSVGTDDSIVDAVRYLRGERRSE
jgi:uncharacterized protein YgbK (DUF1537 family)